VITSSFNGSDLIINVAKHFPLFFACDILSLTLLDPHQADRNKQSQIHSDCEAAKRQKFGQDSQTSESVVELAWGIERKPDWQIKYNTHCRCQDAQTGPPQLGLGPPRYDGDER
jgi:hypothetical protein